MTHIHLLCSPCSQMRYDFIDTTRVGFYVKFPHLVVVFSPLLWDTRSPSACIPTQARYLEEAALAVEHQGSDASSYSTPYV